MPGNAQDLKQILGKRIKGVVVKRDTKFNTPIGQVILVFTDDTSFEFYSDYPIMTASRLSSGGMAHARAYLAPPKGTMEIHMEVSLEDE